jgi:uncharacterized membrane protein
MSGEMLRGLVLLVATMTTGLVAGTFALYAHTVMPGLRTTDDRTFVGAFQALDRAIINPWFMGGGFLGSAVLGVASVVVSWNHAAFPWTVVALALYGFSSSPRSRSTSPSTTPSRRQGRERPLISRRHAARSLG